MLKIYIDICNRLPNTLSPLNKLNSLTEPFPTLILIWNFLICTASPRLVCFRPNWRRTFPVQSATILNQKKKINTGTNCNFRRTFNQAPILVIALRFHYAFKIHWLCSVSDREHRCVNSTYWNCPKICRCLWSEAIGLDRLHRKFLRCTCLERILQMCTIHHICPLWKEMETNKTIFFNRTKGFHLMVNCWCDLLETLDVKIRRSVRFDIFRCDMNAIWSGTFRHQ